LAQKVFAGQPTDNAFYDYFHSDIQTLYGKGLLDLWNSAKFDGLWLDLNEATGTCAGECKASKSELFEKNEVTEEKFFEMPMSDGEINTDHTWYNSWSGSNNVNDAISTYYLPFMPGSKNLDSTTISLNATHPSNSMNELDVHNLFGHLQGKVTKEWFSTAATDLKDRRPFIQSRSTFSGSGAYVAHGLGDNQRTWEDM